MLPASASINILLNAQDKASAPVNRLGATLGRVFGGAGLGGLKGALGAIGNAIGSLVRRGAQFATTLGSWAAHAGGLAAVGFIGWGVKLAADYEQATVAMGNLLGSTEKATEILGEMRDFAASSPFAFTDITASGRMMLGMGGAVEDLMADMRLLGDIAAGSGNNLADLTYLFATGRSQVTIYTKDLRELGGRGIPIIGALQKHFGTTAAGVTKLASEGKIAFSDLKAALVSMTQAGGLYHKATEAQSKSIHGLWSNLKDIAGFVATDIGTKLIQAFSLHSVLTESRLALEEFATVIINTISNLPLMFEDIATNMNIWWLEFQAGLAIRALELKSWGIIWGTELAFGLAEGLAVLGELVATQLKRVLDFMASKLESIGKAVGTEGPLGVFGVPDSLNKWDEIAGLYRGVGEWGMGMVPSSEALAVRREEIQQKTAADTERRIAAIKAEFGAQRDHAEQMRESRWQEFEAQQMKADEQRQMLKRQEEAVKVLKSIDEKMSLGPLVSGALNPIF